MILSACEHDTGQRHIEGSCPLISKQKAFKVVLNQMGSCGGRLESVLRTKQGFPFRSVTAIEMQFSKIIRIIINILTVALWPPSHVLPVWTQTHWNTRLEVPQRVELLMLITWEPSAPWGGRRSHCTESEAAVKKAGSGVCVCGGVSRPKAVKDKMGSNYRWKPQIVKVAPAT